MKLGVKEFRERFSELAEGDELVVVTKNGREVGLYQPRGDPAVRARAWIARQPERDAILADWRANTPDWKQRMASVGLDPEGEPLDACD